MAVPNVANVNRLCWFNWFLNVVSTFPTVCLMNRLYFMIAAILTHHPAAKDPLTHTQCPTPSMKMVKGNLRSFCALQDAGKIKDKDEMERENRRDRQQKKMRGGESKKIKNHFFF